MAATNTITIRIDTDGVLRALQSDRFGRFAASEWKRLIDPYTPRDTGNLMGMFGGVAIEPFRIIYTADYAKPVYYNPHGVVFKTAGTNRNPFATDHWDSKAEQAGKAEQLAQTLTTALQRGIF